MYEKSDSLNTSTLVQRTLVHSTVILSAVEEFESLIYSCAI